MQTKNCLKKGVSLLGLDETGFENIASGCDSAQLSGSSTVTVVSFRGHCEAVDPPRRAEYLDDGHHTASAARAQVSLRSSAWRELLRCVVQPNVLTHL